MEDKFYLNCSKRQNISATKDTGVVVLAISKPSDFKNLPSLVFLELEWNLCGPLVEEQPGAEDTTGLSTGRQAVQLYRLA